MEMIMVIASFLAGLKSGHYTASLKASRHMASLKSGRYMAGRAGTK
jgi:hypothetical protein